MFVQLSFLFSLSLSFTSLAFCYLFYQQIFFYVFIKDDDEEEGDDNEVDEDDDVYSLQSSTSEDINENSYDDSTSQDSEQSFSSLSGYFNIIYLFCCSKWSFV